MTEVVLNNVTKRYGSLEAVKSVSLTIADQEFVVLVGPSGCGKSTTLRMVAGLEEISEGTIQIGGQTVNDLPPKDRDIAMVFQNYALYQHMTVYANLAFGLRNRKVSEDEIKRQIDRAASILGISELMERKPHQLSGGQQQRVALGRCLVRNPAVFLFDEPLSNLDAKLRAQMRLELKELRTRVPTTSIYVTHDQVEAMTLGDRIVVMKDGLVQQAGTPLELYRQPANRFVAGFLGSPAMNFVSAGIKQTNNGLSLAGFGRDIALPAPVASALAGRAGARVVLGIRPEHVTLGHGGDNGFTFEGRIVVTEQLGAHQVAEIRTEDAVIMAAGIDPDLRLQSGDAGTFSVSFDRILFFEDDEAGAAIWSAWAVHSPMRRVS